ncbi:MAG TPA: hypothetical protein VLX68_06695 [Chitinivibrionales bacterium]|nr:hypothetical protein [Chitinivibrionales bacterium]
MASGDSYKSYRKALLLLAILIIVLIIGNNLLKISQMSSRPMRALFGQEVPDGVPFGEAEKDSVKKKIAGFWQSVAAVDSAVPFLRVTDKFEVKPNGIYWRVKYTVLLLPSGDSASYLVASTGFMSPYCHSATSPDSISCQVHYIGQAVAFGGDSCYTQYSRPDLSHSIVPQLQGGMPKPGEGVVVDTIWYLAANGRRFEIDNKKYSPYDTAGPALFSFFPKGSTEMVNKISLRECRGDLSPETIIKRALASDLAKVSAAERSPQDILAIIDKYYKVLFAQNLARQVTFFSKGTVDLSLAVTPEGKVIEPNITKSKPLNMKLNAALKKELLTWVFPVCKSQNKPVKVTFSFAY